jgi:hypothetical protein
MKRMSTEKNQDAKRLDIASPRKPPPRHGKARRPPNRATAIAETKELVKMSPETSQKFGNRRTVPSLFWRETNTDCSGVRSPKNNRATLNEPAAKATPAYVKMDLK